MKESVKPLTDKLSALLRSLIIPGAILIQVILFATILRKHCGPSVLVFALAAAAADVVMMFMWLRCRFKEPILVAAPMTLFGIGAAVRAVIWVSFGCNEDAIRTFGRDTAVFLAVMLLSFWLSNRMFNFLSGEYPKPKVGFWFCAISALALNVVGLGLKRLTGITSFSVFYQLAEIPFIITLCIAFSVKDFNELRFGRRGKNAKAPATLRENGKRRKLIPEKLRAKLSVVRKLMINMESESVRVIFIISFFVVYELILVATSEMGTLLICLFIFLALFFVFGGELIYLLMDIRSAAHKLERNERKMLIIIVVSIIVLGLGIGLFMFIHNGTYVTVANRFEVWTSPMKFVVEKKEDAYQTHQPIARRAIFRGELWGCRELTDLQIKGFPESSTDVIFANICQMFGAVTGVFVVVLFFAWIVSMIRVLLVDLPGDMKKTPYNVLSRFVGVGLAASMFMGMIIHLLSNTGVGMMCGISMPFASRGLASLCLCGFTVGFMARRLFFTSEFYEHESAAILGGQLRDRADTVSGWFRPLREKAAKRKPMPEKVKKGLRMALALVGAFIIAVIVGGVVTASSVMNSAIGKIGKMERSAEHPAAVAEVGDVPLAYDDDVVNILLLGLDDSGDEKLSDVMKIVTIDFRENDIKMVTVQRDSYVYIPGRSQTPDAKYKINSAYGKGGAAMAIDTVEANFRVRIDGAVTVPTEGFAALTEEVGGVDIMIDHEAEARYLNASKDTPRTDFVAGQLNHFDGKAALCYARMRHSDDYDDSTEYRDDNFKRSARQDRLINALFKKVMSGDLKVMYSVLSGDFIDTLDTTFEPEELRSIGLRAAMMLVKKHGSESDLAAFSIMSGSGLSLPVEGHACNTTVPASTPNGDDESILKIYVPYNGERLREYIYGN